MFKKFTSYIEERKEGVDPKSGLAGSPKVKLVADYDGPDPKNPTKGKGQGDLSPYKSANGNAAARAAEKGGFGDLGDGKLKYEPDMKDGNSKLTALGKELGGDWPKNKMPKTEQFLNKTRKMSASQFAKYMLKEASCDNEAIRYIVDLANENPRVLEHLAHEMKRANILGKMLKATLDIPESYQELTILFGDNEGERRANKFARAMAEMVGPSMGLTDNNDDRNMDDEQDMDDDKVEPPDDEENPDDLEDEHPENDPDEEHDDTDEDEDDDEGGMEDHEDDDMGHPHDDDEESDPFGKEDESPEQNVNPMKKKLPHEHLKDAMQKAFMRAFMNK